MPIKKLTFLFFFLSSTVLSFGQDIKDEDYDYHPTPKLILKINPLALIGGNSALNFSVEKPLTPNQSFEFDANYFLPIAPIENQFHDENDLTKIKTDTKGGYGFYISYKFFLLPKKPIQMFLGPHLGLRNINYEHERLVCTEIQETSFQSGLCPCLNLENNKSESQSKGISYGLNFGFRSNYAYQLRPFFWGFQTVVGLIRYTPNLTNFKTHITCSYLTESVAELEKDIVPDFQQLASNSSVQFTNETRLFFLLQLKFGYAF